MIKQCVHCDIEFDTESARKKEVGGRINECIDCVEELGTETAIKHRGLVDFTNNNIRVMSFKDKDELERFNKTKDSENSRLD